MTHLKIPFHDTDWENVQPGVRQKRLVSDLTQIRLVEFDRSFIEKDYCIKGHTGYVIEGEMHIDFEDQVLKYETGDAIHIPAGQKHKVSVTSDHITLFLVEEAH